MIKVQLYYTPRGKITVVHMDTQVGETPKTSGKGKRGHASIEHQNWHRIGHRRTPKRLKNQKRLLVVGAPLQVLYLAAACVS